MFQKENALYFKWLPAIKPTNAHNPTANYKNLPLSNDYRHSNRHAPRVTQKRNVRSKIWWFTRFCNSHYVSHFAAFFIVARAKTSVATSCFLLQLASCQCDRSTWFQYNGLGCVKFLVTPALPPPRTKKDRAQFTVGKWSWIKCGNDPSAGSPTETLLRLHLPLNGKVWITSRGSASR